jgi:23S rRNA (cytosine1962-C5)-methyltransferase
MLFLHPDRLKPVQQRHPWIFSGAVARVSGEPQDGEPITVCDSGGNRLAVAAWNSRSQIRARVLTWNPDEPIDAAFWRSRLVAAVGRRDLLRPHAPDAARRLVNAEADLLPGLIVDQYGDVLVIQCLIALVDRQKGQIAAILNELLAPRAILERSDGEARQKEGLPKSVGLLHGTLDDALLVIRENEMAFGVDVWRGHKTGFYLDQRENRALVGEGRFSADTDVLNLFSYTGGFGIAAAQGGARHITNVDSSVAVLEQAEANFRRNGIDPDQHEFIAADAFELLRHFRDSGRQFDLIITDPPKFAHSQRDMNRATRGYKDLNWLALRLLRPNGLLATFSCSGLVSADLFQKVIFSAAIDARREAQIITPLTQSPDHPVALTFPESAYLKGLLCRVW